MEPGSDAADDFCDVRAIKTANQVWLTVNVGCTLGHNEELKADVEAVEWSYFQTEKFISETDFPVSIRQNFKTQIRVIEIWPGQVFSILLI